MEITHVFLQIAESESINALDKSISSPQPFLLKANELYFRLSSFEAILKSSYQGFVGYHRFLPETYAAKSLIFSEEEKKTFSEEVMSFISIIANEIQDLHRQLDQFTTHQHNTTPNQSTLSPSHMKFYQQSISGLLEELSAFTRQWDRMYKQSQKQRIKGSRLLSHYYKKASNTTASLSSTTSSGSSSGTLQVKVTSSSSSSSSSSTTNFSKNTLATRYLDAITTPKKLSEYQSIATTHKAMLLQEATSLQQQFSTEMLQSTRMESVVMQITSLISDFTTLLEGQSQVVSEVHEMASQVTGNVKQTETELTKTLERQQSNPWSMAMVMIVLGVILLMLHLVTP